LRTTVLRILSDNHTQVYLLTTGGDGDELRLLKYSGGDRTIRYALRQAGDAGNIMIGITVVGKNTKIFA
jgi:hypothetical protein